MTCVIFNIRTFLKIRNSVFICRRCKLALTLIMDDHVDLASRINHTRQIDDDDDLNHAALILT